MKNKTTASKFDAQREIPAPQTTHKAKMKYVLQSGLQEFLLKYVQLTYSTYPQNYYSKNKLRPKRDYSPGQCGQRPCELDSGRVPPPFLISAFPLSITEP